MFAMSLRNLIEAGLGQFGHETVVSALEKALARHKSTPTFGPFVEKPNVEGTVVYPIEGFNIDEERIIPSDFHALAAEALAEPGKQMSEYQKGVRECFLLVQAIRNGYAGGATERDRIGAVVAGTLMVAIGGLMG